MAIGRRERLGELDNRGGTGGVVIGAVVDQIGVGILPVTGSAHAEVVEVAADDDDFVGERGAFTRADAVDG